VPARHLETLLQALVRAKILQSVRGPSGGYQLARESYLITVGEIVRTDTAKRAAYVSKAAESSRLISKVVEPRVQKAGESAMTNLDVITVEDLCNRAIAAGIAAKL
jgi:Rrf2 family protein